jgi:hypothetical protein
MVGDVEVASSARVFVVRRAELSPELAALVQQLLRTYHVDGAVVATTRALGHGVVAYQEFIFDGEVAHVVVGAQASDMGRSFHEEVVGCLVLVGVHCEKGIVELSENILFYSWSTLQHE